MKKVKIAHLYYDLMNLYGENGNIRYLKKKFEDIEADVSVHFLSIGDKIDYSQYDIYYMGTGSEENKWIVLDDMLKYKNDIKKAIDDNKFFLITGNSLDLFGKSINKIDGEEIEALGLLDFTVNEEEFRIVGEQLYSTHLVSQKIIGFQNRSSVILSNNEKLFTVIKGTGNTPDTKDEGVLKNNFYGTYLLGPILVRNPYFTDAFVNNFCKTYGIKTKKANYDGAAYKAYKKYLENFSIN